MNYAYVHYAEEILKDLSKFTIAKYALMIKKKPVDIIFVIPNTKNWARTYNIKNPQAALDALLQQYVNYYDGEDFYYEIFEDDDLIFTRRGFGSIKVCEKASRDTVKEILNR